MNDLHESRTGGQRPCLVPWFTEKLKILLSAQGRNQAWLAARLGVSDTAVTNWKRRESDPETVEGRLPERHVTPLCQLFGIDRSVLLAPGLESFHQQLRDRFAPGSGRPWSALLRRQTERSDGLRLIVGEQSDGTRLRNLSFRSSAPVPRLSALINVRADQRVRLAFSDSLLAELGRDGPIRDGDWDVVLCCEDRDGWQVICPSPDTAGFRLHEGTWLMPPHDRDGLYLHEPLGRWTAVAVVMASKLPQSLVTELRSEPRNRLTSFDLLALWLEHEKIVHGVFSRPFMVTPPASPARRGGAGASPRN